MVSLTPTDETRIFPTPTREVSVSTRSTTTRRVVQCVTPTVVSCDEGGRTEVRSLAPREGSTNFSVVGSADVHHTEDQNVFSGVDLGHVLKIIYRPFFFLLARVIKRVRVREKMVLLKFTSPHPPRSMVSVQTSLLETQIKTGHGRPVFSS